jgi:hypothetical protein
MQAQPINPFQGFNEQTAARLIGISESNLRARRGRGLVPFTRVGSRVLYTTAHVAAILNAGQQSPTVTTTRT